MRLNDFSGIVLPDGNASDQIGKNTRTNIVNLREGVLDQDGAKTYQQVGQSSRQAWFVNGIDTAIDDLSERMHQGLGILRAKMRDDSTRMMLAKLTAIMHNADVNSYYCWQPYTVRFQHLFPFWFAEDDGRFLDSGYTLNSGRTLGWQQQKTTMSASTDFNVKNLGTAPVVMMYIHITCTYADAVSNITITNRQNGMQLNYSGTVGGNINGEHLIIDPYNRAVWLNYVSDVSKISIPNPKQTVWMQLERGTNPIRLNIGAMTGSPEIGFEFLRHYE